MIRSFLSLCVLAVLGVLGAVPPRAAAQSAAAAPAGPAAAQPILPLDQVRIGAKGYGLTVFSGAAIEPFPVEVVSIMRDFAPRKGVIWIRCPDERMQKTGPVAGMSGSPIYLWDDNEKREPGKGGKLIGAFAFGYRGSKDCYVGVQPIEAMRAVGGRAGTPGTPGNAQAQPTGQAPDGVAMLRALVRQAARENLPAASTWRARALLEALSPKDKKVNAGADAAPASALPAAGPDGIDGKVAPLLVPVALRSAGLAKLFGPVFESVNLCPMQAPAGVAGSPPPGVDPLQVRFAPGSVLSVPLGSGDIDLSAVGTVTDVLPDGRVLAFGHPLFGQGPTALPMATGYVHFVMPGLINSFKLGGSCAIRGGIVQDESSAIVGRPDGQFATSPVTVEVHMPGLPPHDYHYQVVQHRALTPMVAATLAVESLTAETGLPLENTIHLQGRMRFAGNRAIKFDSQIPNGNEQAVAMDLVPALQALIANQHGSTMLEALEMRVDVEPVVRSAAIAGGRLERGEVAPGDTLGVLVRLQPYGKEAITQRVEVPIPQSLADGEYNLTICDAQTYLHLLYQNRPHLQNTTSVDDVFALVQQVLSQKDNALYVLLQLPDQGLAVGREELPQLPSSRRAMIATPTSTVATPFADWARQVVRVDYVTAGQLGFSVAVKKDLARKER